MNYTVKVENSVAVGVVVEKNGQKMELSDKEILELSGTLLSMRPIQDKKSLSYRQAAVLETIIKAGAAGIKRSDVLRKCQQVKADNLDRIIGSLEDDSKIKTVNKKSASGKGRVGVFYTAI